MENLPESPFSDLTFTSSPLSPSSCNISSSPGVTQQNPLDFGDLTPNQLVLLLPDVSLRDEAIYQLIKKRDTCQDLAPLLWNTFNAVYVLLLEVISAYWNMKPLKLSMRESTRACNALALFQVMANNPETRRELIKARIPCYFYPFLKASGVDKPLEYLRLTSLGVLGSLAKFDDAYGPMVLDFFLETKVVPYCLECMDRCDELAQKVATLILMKILMQVEGLTYCCATAERFYSIVQVLYKVVQKLSRKPCLLHLNPCDAFKNQIPPQLFNNTFKDIIRDDHETSWMLQVLHLYIYGSLNFVPVEKSKKVAKPTTTYRKKWGKK